ncbi:MAG: peptidylprolyl isomerase, partial [Actinobacteria bacterium]|nr:peptidylprolyl isomerase [Actinomycetota bacterium]
PAVEHVRGTVAGMLRDERTRDAFAERANRTLFTIHSRRTTLGEFLRERDELPTATLAQYAGTAGLRRLLDGMIDRLLVVEDATEMALDVDRRDDISHIRTDLLARFLHQEQVDEALKLSDEEILREYRRNRGRYTEPARVKVRYIRVSRGQTDDADRIARSRITEARNQLVPRGFLRRGTALADFAQVAAQYSEDPDTAAKGGDLDRWIGESGNVMDEALSHRVHQALLPLNVGQLSPVLPLGDSYYLFEIREKQEARALSFEEARDLVRHDLEDRRHEELSGRLLRDLEGRVQLRIYERRLRALRDGLEDPARADGS